MDEAAIHRLVCDIYGTVVDSDEWTDVLQRIARLAGAKAANLSIIDHVVVEVNSRFMCPETRGFSPRYMQSPYMELELKAMSRFSQVQTEPGFCETGDFISRANGIFTDDPIDLIESEDWLFREWGARSRYISRLNVHPSYLDMCTLVFADMTEIARMQGVDSMSILTLHLAKAIELSRPFLLLKSRFQATLEVLDRFKLAVFILSANGEVLLKNVAADAVLDQADALTMDAYGKLKSELAVDSPGIDAIVERVLGHQRQGKIRPSTEFVLQRRSKLTPYLGEITPLTEPSVIGPLSGLMIILIDPDHRKTVSSAGMARIFEMTGAESEICQLLIDGRSTDEIAEMRNVLPGTVKNQIKSVLGKTGNRSRAELIRQALSINLPVEKTVTERDGAGRNPTEAL